MGKVTVKEALCHPDNVFGAAVLLASLAISEDEPGAHFDWFLNRCLPAAAPYLKPISVNEPAVGTGVMILAHAAASPEWAVRNYIIRYFAQDIDPLMVACTRSSLQLYGINSYSCHLTQSFAENARVYFQKRSANVCFQENTAKNDKVSASTTGPTFADLFKQSN